MSTLAALFLFLFLLLLVLARTEDDLPTFAVALTTIPPRFTTIHHVLKSWLEQESFEPLFILVLVPKTYQRFRRKSDNDEESERLSTLDFLTHSLRENAPAQVIRHLESGKIRLEQVDDDFGPATKLAGMLSYRAKVQQQQQQQPTFWVFGDDDVAYTPQTLLRYYYRIILPPPGLSKQKLGHTTVLTHFSRDVRLTVQIPGEKKERRVLHVQGVDTVLLSDDLLKEHLDKALILHPGVFSRLLRFVFKACPDSFMQDDYVLSLLFNFADLRVVSAWNNDHVAKHIEGVSKSNSQMHMKPNVHEREEAAKNCLKEKAGRIFAEARQQKGGKNKNGGEEERKTER